MDKKLIVITGASSGFGKEMAHLFSEQGYPLLLLGRRVELMEEFKLPNTLCEAVDVCDYEAFEKAVRKAEAHYGPTDLLINNAGQMLLGNIWTQDPKEWQSMLNTNVMGVLKGMKIVVDKMKENKTGSIINISSIAGQKAFNDHAAYCASKFGVHGLTETVRSELAMENIRVMLISPGASETELLSHTTDQQIVQDYNSWKDTMGGVAMNPRAIAKAALYMYQMPQDIIIRELVIAPTKQDN